MIANTNASLGVEASHSPTDQQHTPVVLLPASQQSDDAKQNSPGSKEALSNKTDSTEPTHPVFKQPKKPKKIGSKQTKRQILERWLNKHWRFKYNVLNGRVEYCLTDETDFRPLDDKSFNTIIRQLDQLYGEEVAADRLKAVLKSDFSRDYHPIRDYFNQINIANIKGFPTITAMAATVETDNPELFNLALKNWLVASVANALTEEGCQNQTCLVLTGGSQGQYKSTWLNLLCPRALNRYLFAGKIDLGSKDTWILLGEKFIINLDDQLRELNKKDAETIKTLITQGTVTVRRPYDSFSTDLSRLGSFCGSINGNQFLADTTGSRRFMPFEINKIDIEAAQAIDIDQVWAEALALYKSGYRYFLKTTEMATLFQNNNDFQVVSPEYELLLEYYEPVVNAEWANEFLTVTNIQADLERATGIRLSLKKLGENLKKIGFIQMNKRIGGSESLKRYAVRRRTDEERQQKKQEV